MEEKRKELEKTFVGKYVLAIETCKEKGENKLYFKKGDIVKVKEVSEDCECLRGKTKEGKFGWFPRALVSPGSFFPFLFIITFYL